ncbi:tripartite motif-containing protein 3 [Nerophis ophidion]|uniref:tripartite motif-containing protein 3 n=1 Tax=Nerophis ophidion TaxID=159077 RepID=UPI002ADFB8F2|nr:tripartite motif-containing protein 3 [Nerophis ophidion]
MVLCGEGDCCVCLLAFSRSERIPRLLHCQHTFCQPCLESLQTRAQGGLLTLGCPLCRRVTCIRAGLSLQEALWVDSDVWEQIGHDDQDHAPEGGTASDTAAAESTAHGGVSRSKRRLSTFFRKLRLSKRRRETIVPSSNVEMKSWRRLPAEDAA